MPSNCSIEADDAFGPVVSTDCRNGFDFTLLFEQTVLSLVPAIAFLVASPIRIGYLSKKNVRTQSNAIRIIKLIVTVIFASIQLVLLICWARHAVPRTRVSVPSATINFVVAIELFILSWVEDARSVKPSSLISAWLLLTLLFDIAQARTLWLRYLPDTMVPGLFTASIISKTIVLISENMDKRRYLTARYQDIPPESTSGIINRSFMWWINTLFVTGSRCLLTINDLYVLDKELCSESLRQMAQRAWAQRKRPERRFEVAWKICIALWQPLAMAAFPRLCLIGFTFAQPFLIQSLLEWLNDAHSAENTGYGLIGATILVYLGLAVSTLHYNHLIYRFVTMFRGAASSLIYWHALHVPDGSVEDRSAAITLMTTDIDRITVCLVDLNECWARTIEVAMGITLLALRLGWVSVMPVIVVIISSIGSSRITKNIGSQQKMWVDAVQQRVSMITSMLTEIQTVKQMGLGKVFANVIQEKRIKETQQMAKFRWSIVWQNAIQNLPWALAPALTFAVYAAQGESLNLTEVFSNLSIITLLTDPVSKLLSAIPSTAAALGCFDRIQNFMLIPVNEENHVMTPTIDDDSESQPQKNSNDSNASPLAVLTAHKRETHMINMNSCNILPTAAADFMLQDINFQACRGDIIMIWGTVGSGKSTFLRAILGQAVCETGLFQVAHRNFAYCAQTPWLPNDSIRNAICGNADADPANEEDIDHEWYKAVLHACALEPDLSILPESDCTQISSGSGTTLSGGQTHRVALARAVYARKELVLLDNTLSALDTNTKAQVMERLFGKSGIFRRLKSTVLLVTHDDFLCRVGANRYTAEHLSYADKVLTLPDGNFKGVEKGVYALPEAYAAGPANVTKDVNDSILPAPKEKAAQVSQDNQLNDLTRATGDLTVYNYYFRSIGWSKALLFVGFVTINTFCNAFSQIWLERWADQGGKNKPFYVTIYNLLAILNVIGNGGYVWAILVLISPSTARKLHYVVLKAVMKASPGFLASTDTGTILNRFSQDMTLIEGQLPVGVLITVSNLFTSIASAALIAAGSTYVAVSVPFLILAVFLLQYFYLKTSRQLRLLDLESRSPLYSNFLQTISGLATIQAFGWEEQFLEKNARLLDVSQRPYYLLYCIQRWLTLVLDLIVTAEAVLVVCLVVGLRHSTSVGLLGVSLNSILSFNTSLSSLITGWTQLEISLGSISRVRRFEMETAPEETTEKGDPPANWPNRGVIEYRGVTAEYNCNVPVLRDLSFTVQSGQKIGICGRTGSGKSSLLGILLGMLDVTDGSIIIDGIALSTISRETVREKLVTIAQDPLLLVGCTVRFNADPTGQLPDTDVINALIQVGLWEGLLAERGGLDAEIKSTSSLSKGQQQLFGLARAMLKLQHTHTKIVLLDEATSNVDSETDERMQKVLRQEPFSSCSILTIAHRIQTIIDSDIVIVLDQGRVIEIGDPRELARRKRSTFAGLLQRIGY